MSHFVQGLGIPSARAIKAQIHGNSREVDEMDEFDEDLDIDTSMEVDEVVSISEKGKVNVVAVDSASVV